MPKKTISEKFVQRSVAESLNRKYYRRKSAFVDTEVYTRLKRADVLLAFMRTRKRPYVVVVEAKSRTTIHQLKLTEKPSRTQWAGRLVTLSLIVGLSAILGYQWYFNALNTLLLLGLFILGSVLISSLIRSLELSILGAVGAIEQLARYPANEKWIAIGEDSIVDPRVYATLSRQCRKNGVGLIVVTESGKLKLRELPTPRHTFNDYLSHYGKQKDILARISRSPDYGPTPPERRKMRRQVLNAATMLGTVVLLGLISYEGNYGPVVPDPFEDYAFGTEDPEPTSESAGERDSSQRVVIVEESPESPYDCTSLRVERRSYIVVDALLRAKLVEDRLEKLRSAGIEAMQSIATDCLNSWPAPGRVALYTGVVYPNRAAAAAAAKEHNRRLKEHGIPAAYGRPVKVRPGVQE